MSQTLKGNQQEFDDKSHIGSSGADPGFGQGGAPGAEAESCRRREASNLRPASRARLRALEAFGVLMLKYMHSPTF